MVGKKQHLLEELAEKNAKDEFEDHFANLCKWMQSKGIKVVTKHSEMEQLTNCTKFDIYDGMSTEQIIDMLIVSEQEAIDVYEDLIPQTELDLNVMLCGFLKDEREHLKELMDVRNEMIGGRRRGREVEEITTPFKDDLGIDDVEKVDEGVDSPLGDDEETMTYTASGIQWDTDGDKELFYSLPTEIDVEVPVSIVDGGDESEIEQYISDYITDVTGYCHNGFSY